MSVNLKYAPRKVGTDLVTAIGYGAMGFGGMYGKTESDEERFKVLDKLYEMGCTNWDTAALYGDSEEVIGKWFKRTGLRDKIFLATKFGFDMSNGWAVRNDTPFIKEQLAQSLERLQTDHIDLYYVHRTDNRVPIESTMKVLKGFFDEGKIRYIGLSDCNVNTMRRAQAIHPISAIQIEYSPFEITQEGRGILECAREFGMAIFAYSPNGRGLATGRYKSPEDFDADDFRRQIPKYSAENFPRVLQLAESLAAIGKAHNNATAAQVTIAWLLSLAPDIIPLPGSKQPKYVEENFRAGEIVLSQEEQKEIRKLVDDVEKAIGKDPVMFEAGALWSYVDTPLPGEEPKTESA